MSSGFRHLIPSSSKPLSSGMKRMFKGMALPKGIALDGMLTWNIIFGGQLFLMFWKS